jgi:CRISPR-associated protein Csm4
MPTLIPFDLTFFGGVRSGARGVSLEESGAHVPSDTLFSALMDCARRAGRDVGALIAQFQSAAPPFKLSSVFPRAGTVRFVPIPPGLFDHAAGVTTGKALKKITYMSTGILRRLHAGEKAATLLPDPAGKSSAKNGPGVFLQAGSFWMHVDEAPALPSVLTEGIDARKRDVFDAALRNRSFWRQETRPRVTVSRAVPSSQIFYASRSVFAAGCGMWFGAQDGGGLDTLKALLARLEDDGLGGERGVGYGAFAAAAGAPFTLDDAAPGQAALLLSRYWPTEAELPAVLQPPLAAYELTPVGGWMRAYAGAAQRRKRVLMLSAGSRIAMPASPCGGLARVTPVYASGTGSPPHEVYRYGLGLTVRAP